MFLRLAVPFFGLLLVSACADRTGAAAEIPSTAAPQPPAGVALPKGAILEPSGFATIVDAPPAPFAPTAPGAPPPPTPDQIAGQRQFARAGSFQNSVMSEVMALDARLRREQRGNYVSVYYDNEGEPSAVFQFLRDGPATLARYTRHPQFIGRNVRFSEAQLRAAGDFMWRTFGEDRVIHSTGIGRNEVNVTVSVSEPEFRALVVRKGVTLPEAVELTFLADRPAAALNPPLPPEIAPLVRIFPRDDRPAGMLHDIYSRAKVELRDGCLRIANRDGALALLPLGTRLFVDREGYLAFGAESPGYGRVGETLTFPGSIEEVTAPELVGPIHAACGPGRVLKINGTASAAAHGAQQAVTANEQAVRLLRESYGLSEAGARRAVERCRQMSGSGVCLNSPPRPVPRQEECPAGTRLSFGLCRTPEGFVRPLPAWLEEFADD
jgi:hypothetical protein